MLGFDAVPSKRILTYAYFLWCTLGNLYLVQSGTVEKILTLPGLTRELALPGYIIVFPLVWVSSVPGVGFNITASSEDTSVILDPIVLPYAHGIVPTEPLGVAFLLVIFINSFYYHLVLNVLFKCLRSNLSPIMQVITIATFSNDTGEPFCPITFQFGKFCSGESKCFI